MLKSLTGTDCMHSTNKLTQLMQVFKIIQLRRATTLPRINSKIKMFKTTERACVGFGIDNQGRHHGNIDIVQVLRITMLFKNLLSAPTLRSIEFHDHRRLALNPHLIHAIFVAIQSKNARIAQAAGRLYRVDHDIGR